MVAPRVSTLYVPANTTVPSRERRPPSVLLLGVGQLGREVAQRLLEEGEGKLVGIVARDRGAFDARGLSRSVARELMRHRSVGGGAQLDFPNYEGFLAQLAKQPWPLLVDCTGAQGVERVYADAGRRGIRVTSAAWLAPRPTLWSAATAMIREPRV